MIFPGLTDSEAQALVDTATSVGMDPQWLWEVINFESGHDPQKQNPRSSAKGLIQFMDQTAQAMGFANSWDLISKYPDYESQMRGPVKDYFTTQVRGPFPTRQSVYMGVFMPVARNVPPDTTMQSIYEQNPKSLGGLTAYQTKFVPQNPGILTVADYVNKTLARAQGKWPAATVKEATLGGGALLLLLALAFIYLKKN